MVNVGVVGLGPDWETRYGPALRDLRQRIAVCAIYDAVASRAGQAAAEWNADAVEGIVALSERPDLRAFLLIDAGWYRWEALRILCRQDKPVYVAGTLGGDAEALRALGEGAAERGQTIVPELGRRYMPATVRLRELMATHLGPPHTITVDCALGRDLPAATPGATRPNSAGRVDPLVGLFDWCRYIVGTSPVRLQATELENGTDAADRHGRAITIAFAPRRGNFEQPQAKLRLRVPNEHVGSRESPPRGQRPETEFRCEVVCRDGRASVNSPVSIAWSVDGRAPVSESLTGERRETVVMLDHFCRRVVGGLIPVAGLSDVLRGLRVAEAAADSFRSGRAVELNGQLA